MMCGFVRSRRGIRHVEESNVREDFTSNKAGEGRGGFTSNKAGKGRVLLHIKQGRGGEGFTSNKAIYHLCSILPHPSGLSLTKLMQRHARDEKDVMS